MKILFKPFTFLNKILNAYNFDFKKELSLI